MTTPSIPARSRVAAALGAVVLLATGAAIAVNSTYAGADACSPLPASLPAAGSLPAESVLPDPFRAWDGTRLTSPAQWSCRRAQLSELIQFYQYGHLPTAPTTTTGTRNGNTLTVTVQANGRTASFTATLSLPSGTGPFPAIIMLNPLAASTTTRGYAEVRISPNSIAADSTAKTGAFWTLYGTGVDTGVLMAWAWGVHRTLDALTAVPQIDRTRVGVSGYSRYGKAALVAGAFDERIAATFPGSSGTAGVGDYRFFFTNGTNDETLNNITDAFPFWFTSRFTGFRSPNVNRLPFDQHSLAALVAPRLLLATNGTDGSDIRTNPQGAGLVFRGAQMVYQYLGVRERIGIAYRPGGHQIDMNDYNAIMDFSDKYLRGLPVSRTFENVPYPAPTAAQIPWTLPPVGPTTPPPTTASPTASPTSSPTASPTSSPLPGGCRVAYTLSPWGTGSNGFTAGLTLTNTGSSPLTWTLRFTLPAGQAITPPGWAANWSTSAQNVTATGLSWNATLQAGQSTTIGFNGTHTGNTSEPASYTVNNTACAVA